ncbi:Protein saal1 [Larimichthys crocea]|uniref:Uncharacterized protein n=1 Tax=Larimichthys crocea TaxID=215358 RepID=A0ACD3QET8_LARCR|nr:Protein saal1 [Larimichthys crocea]
MDCRIDGAEDVEAERSSSPAGTQSPVMDPFNSRFLNVCHVVQMVTEHSEVDSEGQMQLPEDDEEDLCRVWDMAMDKCCAVASSWRYRSSDSAGNEQVTFAFFCISVRQTEREIFIFSVYDVCRLLLTCVSQKDVCSIWLQRIRQQTSVRTNLCFIMCSSTNTDLLEKVGELVEKLFDLDEELMKGWITAQPSERRMRKMVKTVWMWPHVFLRQPSSSAAPDGPGKAIWDFVSDVVCEDLYQPNDLPVVLQEQKSILIQAFAVLHALYRCQEQWSNRSDTSLPLIGTILRLLQHSTEGKHDGGSKEDTKDEQLQALAEITAEFLADICIQIPKVFPKGTL